VAVSFVRGRAYLSPVFLFTAVLATFVFFFSSATVAAGGGEAADNASADGMLAAQLSTVRFAHARANTVQRPDGWYS
jgi:hypothetical protein